MINCIIVGVGGFIGAILRYLISLINLNDSTTFPYKTLITNILGSLLIGIIAGLTAKHNLDSRIVLLIKVGICGGFTTYSTFALESLELFQGGKITTSILYIALSLVLCINAVFIGQLITK